MPRQNTDAPAAKKPGRPQNRLKPKTQNDQESSSDVSIVQRKSVRQSNRKKIQYHIQ